MKRSKLSRGFRLVATPAAVSALALAAASAAHAQDLSLGAGNDATTDASKDAAKTSDMGDKKSDMDNAVQATMISGDPVTKLYDDVEKWKSDNHIPIEVGAWHWWHMNRLHPHDFMYGQRGLEGTYYYYLKFDPEMALDNGAKVGAHIDARARDGDASFRPFYESNLWLWEAYGWVDVCDIKIKAGKIWRRFGLDWDGSWYGNVAYFDGWKLDPDWGASVEHTCHFSNGMTMPTFVQAFFAQDKVNGSLVGADAESDEHASERESVVLRAVPTWTSEKLGTFAVGGSWQAGKINHHDRSDNTVTAGAVDASWSKSGFKAFAEWIQTIGERNSANYVTGGGSSSSKIGEIGGSYTYKWATLKANVSHGEYDNPGGSQVLYLVGVDFAVLKNVTFTCEYVRWDTKAQHGSPRAFFEDGFSFVINWHF
jgi:hypothetical protein